MHGNERGDGAVGGERMAEEVDEEAIFANIRRCVSRFKRIKQILDSGIIRIAGEDVPLSSEIRTILENKKTEVKSTFQIEVKKLLVE